jgi:hypothetical protein
MFAAVLLAASQDGEARLTAPLKCQLSKAEAVPKYTLCRHHAYARLLQQADSPAYAEAITLCTAKLTSRWRQADTRAADAGATCPDQHLDVQAVAAVLDQCTANVDGAIAGASLAECSTPLGINLIVHCTWSCPTSSTSGVDDHRDVSNDLCRACGEVTPYEVRSSCGAMRADLAAQCVSPPLLGVIFECAVPTGTPCAPVP